MKTETLRRTICPVVKVVDAKAGLVEYVASDETIDSYREVIRARGWRFDLFQRNAPFVDSHDYSTIDKLVGRVVDFAVKGSRLVETVKWAIDVADNRLAQLGFKMTEAGYLKAVSVGFRPEKYLTKWDAQKVEFVGQWQAQLLELGLDEATAPRVIYLEQQQVELSSCIIGANPNALAKAYKADCITDADLEFFDQARSHAPVGNDLSTEEQRGNAGSADIPADADLALQRARLGLTATVIRIANKM